MSFYYKNILNLCNKTRGIIQHSLHLPGETIQRALSTSSVRYLKEIKEEKKDELTMIEGVKLDSRRKSNVLPTMHEGACPICQLNMKLKYTDVLILSQFLRPDGCLLPTRVTNVCKSQQKMLQGLVRQAQNAGLLNAFRPESKDGKVNKSRSTYKWKKYNIHFEDD